MKPSPRKGAHCAGQVILQMKVGSSPPPPPLLTYQVKEGKRCVGMRRGGGIFSATPGRTYVHSREENKYGKRRMAPTEDERRWGSYLAHSFGIRTQHKCGGKISEVVGICENRNWREESLAHYSAAPIFFSLSGLVVLNPTNAHARSDTGQFFFLSFFWEKEVAAAAAAAPRAIRGLSAFDRRVREKAKEILTNYLHIFPHSRHRWPFLDRDFNA